MRPCINLRAPCVNLVPVEPPARGSYPLPDITVHHDAFLRGQRMMLHQPQREARWGGFQRRTPQPLQDNLIDLDRYPAHYPFVAGSGPFVKKTAVITRPELGMSDIPQMRDEFARVRRDELLIIGFVDRLARACLQADNEFDDIPVKQRLFLAESLRTIGFNSLSARNIRWFLSRIVRYAGLRYPNGSATSDREYADNPTHVLLDIVASMIGGYTGSGVATHHAIEYEYDSVDDVADFLDCDASLPNDVDRMRIVQALFRMGQINDGRFIFYRNDTVLPPLCVLKTGVGLKLSNEFLGGPSRFIERQENVFADPETMQWHQDQHLDGLNVMPYDQSRVKRFMMGGIPVISKRIEPLRVNRIEEEVINARRFEERLTELGLTDYRTVQYIGIVYDRGNFYVLMRDEQAPSLFDESSMTGLARLENLKQRLGPEDHDDLEPSNAILKDDTLIILDFERQAIVVGRDSLPALSLPLRHARLSSATSLDQVKAEPFTDDESFIELPWFRSALTLLERTERGEIDLPTHVVIGDVHGNAWRLKTILESAAVMAADHVTFVGDYFDRDRGGKRVFDILRSTDAGKTTFLIGNHELFFLLAFAGDRESFVNWVSWGGLNFIDAVMDIGWFKREVNVVYAGWGEMKRVDGVISAINFLLPDLIDRLHAEVRENDFFKSVNRWLVDNGKILNRDAYGMLQVHAGIPTNDGIDVGHLVRLKVIEEKFLDALKQGYRGSLDVARQYAADFQRYLKMREYEWLYTFMTKPQGHTAAEAARAYLANAGISGVAYGHTHHGVVTEHLGRFFNVDASMAEFYEGLGGFLRMSPEGIHAFQFNSRDGDELVRREMVSKEAFLERLAVDARAMVIGFGAYFMRAGLGGGV
ncbi:MAG: metallophosphoesterase [Deltaproteobacteria bacterium]|nr:metallophosphoesterase [Deltaproteobacteria bacterium]